MAEDRMLNDEILLGLIKANGGGGGGTNNYENLNNLPKINSVELKGNKSLSDLGIASAQSVTNITNGESINNFAGVETALSGKQATLTFDNVPTENSTNPVKSGGVYSALSEKQNVLTAGDYIDITSGEISVNREIPPNNFTYEIVTKSTGNDDASMTVKKYANGSLVSSTDYLYTNVSTAVNIDGYLTLQYSNGWKYTLLQASIDHASGYVATWVYQTVVDYTEAFPTEDTSGLKLVIKSELDTALETKQDTLTFDDTPTDGSNNPVKSNGIYDSEKDIYAAMGEMGAKNLISYPYDGSISGTGISWTVNNDGSIVANGQAESNSAFWCVIYSQKYLCGIKKGKSYIINGISGGSANTYQIYVATFLGSTQQEIWFVTDGDKVFTPTQDFDGVSIYCRITSGTSVSDLVFRPMLRLASDTDGTYQPYAKTNKQLTDDVALLDSGKADTDIVASDFDATASYTAGNYCIYEGKFYKFKASHSGAWSASDVDEIKIAGELSSLKSGLTNYQTQNDLNLEVPNRKNLFIGIYGANSTTVYSPVKPSTKYTISTKSTGASQINMQYIYTDDTIGGNAALCPSGSTSNSITVTTPSNAKGIEIYAVADASAQSYASETQIELGSTATTFAPYIPSVESRIEALNTVTSSTAGGFGVFTVGKLVMLNKKDGGTDTDASGNVLYNGEVLVLPSNIRPVELVTVLDAYSKKRIQIKTNGNMVLPDDASATNLTLRFTAMYLTS